MVAELGVVQVLAVELVQAPVLVAVRERVQEQVPVSAAASAVVLVQAQALVAALELVPASVAELVAASAAQTDIASVVVQGLA